MSFKQKLIIGLADEEVGARVGNVLQHTTATDSALTVGATSIQLGVTGGLVGFLGAAATAAQGVTLSSVTSVAQALINLGLATENT